MSALSATRWTIVQAAQAGDADALRELCAKYRPAIVGWLVRRGTAHADAEDVAQETLVALTGSALARAHADAGSFRSLVFAIARNQLAKTLERRGAAKRGAGRTQPLADMEPAAPSERDDLFDREWLANLVRAALARLARDHATSFEVLRRFILDGTPQAAIARELGLSVENVKKLVFRGKRRVAKHLRDEVWTYAGSSREYETELAYLASLLGPE